MKTIIKNYNSSKLKLNILPKTKLVGIHLANFNSTVPWFYKVPSVQIMTVDTLFHHLRPYKVSEWLVSEIDDAN